MYVLHYAPDNASMIIRLVLEGAGLPYELSLVDRRIRAQDSPAYLALNPTGLIPTLETPFGPISETGAILLWLADRHGLAPKPEDPQRPALLRWLFFTSNTVHADLRQLFYPDQYVPSHADAAHHALLSARVIRHFTLLDTIAQKDDSLFQTDGILAPYLCALMRWSVLYPKGQTPWFTISAYPALARMAQAMETTPQAVRVALAEGLGAQPFTKPLPARPPEGHVT